MGSQGSHALCPQLTGEETEAQNDTCADGRGGLEPRRKASGDPCARDSAAVGRRLALGCTPLFHPPLCVCIDPEAGLQWGGALRGAASRMSGHWGGLSGGRSERHAQDRRVPCSYQAAFLPDAQTWSRGPGPCSCLCHLLLRPEGSEGGCVHHQTQGSPVQGAHDLLASSEPLCA